MRKWALLGFGVVLASGIVEMAFPELAHGELWWHRAPWFDFAYGLTGCLLIVLLSKWLGHRWLQRDESYYERDAR